MATTDFLTRDQAFAVAIQPDGKIVVAGRATVDSRGDRAVGRARTRER